MTVKVAPEGPAWLQGAGARQHSAVLYRRLLRDLSPLQGICNYGDLAVTAGGGMNVSVSPGRCIIHGTEAADQGSYECYNDAPILKAIAAANPTNPRYDLVVMQVKDSAYSGLIANEGADIAIIQGDPAAAPVAPALPANSLLLETVRINVGDATVQSSRMTDNRISASALKAPRGIVAWGIQPSPDQVCLALGDSHDGNVEIAGCNLGVLQAAPGRVYKYTYSACILNNYTASDAGPQLLLYVNGVIVKMSQAEMIGQPGANNDKTTISTSHVIQNPPTGVVSIHGNTKRPMYPYLVLYSRDGVMCPASILVEDIGAVS